MNKLLTTLGAVTLLSSGVSPLATINNHIVANINQKQHCGSHYTISPQQQEADAIKRKIDAQGTYDLLPDIPPNTTNINTIKAIKTALKSWGQGLTDADLAKITFNQVHLIAGEYQTVIATITVGTGAKSGVATVNLSEVQIAKSDMDIEQAIYEAINGSTVEIPYNPVKTVKANALAIRSALKQANPYLNNDDIASIFFLCEGDHVIFVGYNVLLIGYVIYHRGGELVAELYVGMAKA